MIALMQVRGSQVSMGAEGGSNALSTENGCTFQNFSEFVDTYKCVPRVVITYLIVYITIYDGCRERSTVVHGP